MKEPTKPQDSVGQELIEPDGTPLQMTTIDAAVPTVMLTTPKLPRLSGD